MFFFLLLVLTFLALVAQHFVGACPGIGGHVLLMHLVFFYAAAALPIEGMLAMAFATGLMWDCVTAVPVDGRVEAAFGTSILIYGALGGVMNGLRPLYLRGRWQLHCVVAGLLTSVLVLVEFVIITFRRVPFEFTWPREVWHRIIGSGIASLLIAPLLFFSLSWLGRRLGVFQKRRLVTPA